MAITIPQDAVKTFEKLMGALGGEDYSYYLFDVKNVNERPRAKKVLEMVVYVPQAQRVTAAANIQGSLEGDDVIAQIREKETELDVFLIGNTAKYIRVLVKPNGSKGSGGGAAATKIQEAAQCVYAAMRYYCGDVKHFTKEDLDCGWQHTNAPGVKLEEIMGLPKEWKEGSWLGAQEIYSKIGSGKKYNFVRGDAVIEDAISKAFNRCKGQSNLSSEDKWNPADIWMVEAGQEAAIKKHLDGENTIDCLNNALLQMQSEKKLIGISLKKITGSANMTLKNDQPAAVRKANEKAHYASHSLTYINNRKETPMDVYLHYGSGQHERFQARNFGGSTKGDWKLELKGKNAAQGKIQGQVVIDLLKNAGFTNISSFHIPTWAECAPGSSAAQKKITTEIYNLLKKYKAVGFDAATNKATAIKNDIALQEKSWRYSKLAGLRFLDWLNTVCSDKDMAMKEMYLYASSQSDKSSVYWKLQ
ncbi:hypothetical protein [Synechococcus phage S-H38]|uniref:Uncharacterized protein n=1 Tax=Synechococcus phage S-H38 TaxID=2783673 RepID=A0A873WFC2_9CAUD|nr:hypothetical protein PQC14_gp015 [Synechococcus phage S-H38]QPB08046.1 hypothetical protein [Synechococcus phage S-H38]